MKRRIGVQLRTATCVALLALLVSGCSHGEGEGTSDQGYISTQRHLTLFHQCLTAAGWNMSMDVEELSLNLEDNLPTEQYQAFRKDEKSCFESLPPVKPPEMTREHAVRQYRHLMKMQDCLRSQGYETGDPPSLEAYVADYVSGRAPWSPYNELPLELDLEEWKEIEEACPPTPEP